MKLSFHRLVQRAVNEVVPWYEEQREGLGDDFFDKLTTVLDEIAAQPESQGFWLGSKTVRRAKLERFPYAVLYEIRPACAVRPLAGRNGKGVGSGNKRAEKSARPLPSERRVAARHRRVACATYRQGFPASPILNVAKRGCCRE